MLCIFTSIVLLCIYYIIILALLLTSNELTVMLMAIIALYLVAVESSKLYFILFIVPIMCLGIYLKINQYIYVRRPAKKFFKTIAVTLSEIKGVACKNCGSTDVKLKLDVIRGITLFVDGKCKVCKCNQVEINEKGANYLTQFNGGSTNDQELED